MTCVLCGDKSKKHNKDFTRAVVEINNPEEIVLFRKVTIPASMGDDTTVQPAIGKYKNVLLVYEVNNHAYLYSSDGVPTLLTSEVAQEMEEEIQELRNNKQDKLTAGDGITIEDDVISALGSGGVRLLTSEDYNYPAIDPDGVAMWLLNSGYYRAETGTKIYTDSGTGASFGNRNMVISNVGGVNGTTIYTLGGGTAATKYVSSDGSLNLSTYLTTNAQIQDNLTTTFGGQILDARQGKILDEKIKALADFSTSETDTGAIWIDGSTIYKKTVNFGTLPNNTMKRVAHNIPTTAAHPLKRFLKVEGYAYDPNFSLNMFIPDGEIKAQATNTDIEIVSTADLSAFTESYVTVYYTKS